MTDLISQLDVQVNLKEWVWLWAIMYGGPMAAMLLWLTVRAEKKFDVVAGKLDFLAHKIAGMTRAMLMDVASREGASEIMRKMATEQLARSNGNGGQPQT